MLARAGVEGPFDSARRAARASLRSGRTDRADSDPSDSDLVDCSHCGLPVPRGLVRDGAQRQFCCRGCESVYALLHEEGLERYYDLIDSGDRRPAATSGRSYAEFDDPSFAERYVNELSGGALETRLFLEGVHCTACVWLVERLPRLLPGVVDTRLDLGRQMAEVVWDPREVALSEIARALDRLGYAVHPFRGADRLELRRREERTLLVKIGIAGACAGNVMLIAAALYAGLFGAMGHAHEQLFRWASLAITIPAIAYSGQVFFRGALAALRARALHMDLPIAVGLGTGFLGGAINTIRGAGEIYFDSVTALIFLLLVGRWVQLRQQRRAADATELLFSLTPSAARLVEDGRVREVPIDALTPGAVVEVPAGETVPVDGVIVAGDSAIDAALLTGESVPEQVGAGAEVCAGTVNTAAPLRIRATATGEETRVGRLMRHVEEQARRRAPIVRAADRVASWFVASALGLALVTVLIWLRIDSGQALENAVALLIVTCPCALGLATPLAVSVAIGRAARQGILVKGGDTLERLARPGTLYLDKTGTLTRGEQRLLGWHGSDATLRRAAAIERKSAHPLARALVAAAGDTELPEATSVSEELGAGIRGRVEDRGLFVGAPATAGPLPADIREFVDRAAELGRTPVVVAEDGRVTAAAAFGDPIRDDARETVDGLRAAGWRVRILSGDDPRVVRAVGAELGFDPDDCIGGASPEEKLAEIRRAGERGRVVMAGDGVNDAAALAAATCGIAVHGSAEASLASADVFIDRPGLSAIGELTRGARRTMGVIYRNLGFSLAYNLAGATLAVTGVIHPLIAAVMMPLSSLTVVTSSIRGRTFGGGRS